MTQNKSSSNRQIISEYNCPQCGSNLNSASSICQFCSNSTSIVIETNYNRPREQNRSPLAVSLETAQISVTDPTPSTPSTPQTPQGSGLKYNWDQSVHDLVLPVRCKNTSAEFHKDKFGSGGRGRCIRLGDEWLTPSEFEAKCGRGSSKDWKRSIRYGGRTLQCLIEESIIQPHATSCTCSACCDDESVTGPVRLFVPYKRRKKDEENALLAKKSNELDSPGVVIFTPTTPTVGTTTHDTIQVVTADGTLVGTAASDTPVITLNTPQLKPFNFNFNEEKQWWHLEESVNNLISCANQLKILIQQIKEQSKISKETALNELRAQMENEKSRTDQCEVLENLHQTESKRCANCNREAFSECTGCHNVSYCSAFCQKKDWLNHREDCGRTSIVFLQEVKITDKN